MVLVNIPTDPVEYVTISGKIGSLPNLPVPMAIHGAIARNDDEILILARRAVRLFYNVIKGPECPCYTDDCAALRSPS